MRAYVELLHCIPVVVVAAAAVVGVVEAVLVGMFEPKLPLTVRVHLLASVVDSNHMGTLWSGPFVVHILDVGLCDPPRRNPMAANLVLHRPFERLSSIVVVRVDHDRLPFLQIVKDVVARFAAAVVVVDDVVVVVVVHNVAPNDVAANRLDVVKLTLKLQNHQVVELDEWGIGSLVD